MVNETNGFNLDSSREAKDRRERLKKRSLLKLVEKESASDQNEPEQQPKSLIERLRLEKEKRRHEESTETKKGKDSPEASKKEIERAKKEVVREHIEEEVAQLEVQIEVHPPGSAEHTQALAAKEFLEKVSERTERADTAVDPAIELEFQKRMTEAGQELAELTQLSPAELDLLRPHKEAPIEKTEEKHEKAASKLRAVGSVFEKAEKTANSPSDSTEPTLSKGSVRPESFAPLFPPTEKRSERQGHRKRSSAVTGFVIHHVLAERSRKRREATHKQKREALETAANTTAQLLKRREAEVKQQAARVREELPPTQVHRPETLPKGILKHPETPAAEVLRRALTHESKPATLTESGQDLAAKSSEQWMKGPKIEKQVRKVDQLATPDVLQIAETFFINGNSVRRLYETNQIDRKGLEKIVKQGLKGGDIKQAFEDVELGRERQRERAREFRHDDPGFTSGTQVSTQAPPTPISPVGSAPTPAPLTNQPNPTSLEPIASTLPTIFNEPSTSDMLPSSPMASGLRNYVGPLIVLAFGLALLIMWFVF